MRGKGISYWLCQVLDLNHYFCPDQSPGIIRAAQQYGVSQRIMDLCTFDVTRNPWRCGGLFDAIITDPPCTYICLIESILYSLQLLDGVRAGAKRLGRKNPNWKPSEKFIANRL